MSGRHVLVCPKISTATAALVGALLLCGQAAASQAPRVTNGGFMQAQLGDKAVPLPLKHTDVDAEVAGTVAAVKVTQQFHNPFRRPIEAVYVFPLPHRAAVHAMTIKVGQRVIEGQVLRRDSARKVYERARRQGKTAALLDQERPNIFTQSVANILPGEAIEVQLRYVEDLAPEDGRYEFAFPMVVGPRYVGANDPLPRPDTGEGWSADTARVPDASRITPRLLAKGLRPGHDIAVRLRLAAGVPIQHLRAITHRVKIQQQGDRATVELDPFDAIPNKDFVVRYQLAGAQPDVAVLAQRDRRGGHFLLMIQPKARMARRDVAPREHVFVVDNSGSMFGFPLRQAQRVVRRCLKSLRPQDTFQIIKFAGTPDQLAERAVPATAANVSAGIGYVGRMQGAGGTEFLPALERALRAPKDPARARIVLFITDGYIGYEADVLRYLRDYGAQSSIFALGIGSSVNRFLIDGMARLGSGAPFYLLHSEKAASVAERVFSTISRPALTSISVDWNGLDVDDVAPATIPDLFGERPVVVAGRYDKGGRAMITVRGQLAGKPFAKQVQVELPAQPTADNAAVAYLWARRQIADWMDRHATARSERGRQRAAKRVTELALRYNLVSQFTSLVAVDTKVRNPGGRQQRTDVPLPLPEGVSTRAAPAHAYARSAGVLGVLRGSSSGSAYGYGGLGLSGKGGGGGGTGQGTIGLGTLGTIGRGGGGGFGVGYGRGVGRLGGRRIAAPAIRVGRAMVTGSLDKNIIRRVIRRHLNEVRYCYQKALQQDPKLAGRLVVEFTVAADGRVVAARVKETTIKAPAFEADLLRAVQRWLFPAVPGGGVVVVSYPFVFRPPT